jgi:hypothetical protein
MWSPHRLHSDGFSSQRTSEGTTAWIEYQTKKRKKQGKAEQQAENQVTEKGTVLNGTNLIFLGCPYFLTFSHTIGLSLVNNG